MKSIKNFFETNLVNIYFIVYSLLSSYFLEIKWILYTIGLLAYTIYIFRKDEVQIVKYIINYAIISTIIIDYLFLYLHIKMPFELKYIPDIVSVLLIYKIIEQNKKYLTVLKDKILHFVLIILILNIIYVFGSDSNLIEYINGLRMYLRFVPIYIVLSVSYIDLNIEYKVYYFINLVLMVAQIVVNTGKDNINGIFGMNGTVVSSIFMLILVGTGTIEYIKREINIKKYVFIVLTTSIVFAFQENKAFILIEYIYIITIFLICRGNLAKKAIVGIVVSIVMVISINLLVTLFPGYESFIKKETFKYEISNYLFNNTNDAFVMGRFESLVYLDKLEMNKNLERLLGNGIGYSTPEENWYYQGIAETFWNDKFIFDINASEFYYRYGKNFGYHLSSLVILYLDLGLNGILLFMLIMLILLKKSIVLLKSKFSNKDDNIWGAIGINIFYASLFGVIYGSEMQNRTYLMIMAIFIGIISFKEKYLNKRKIETGD